MAATVLSYFWELASLDVDRRVKAASSLIAALNTAQSEFAATSAAGGQPLCPDLEYAVRRLVRGLASPRDGARQGFGAALIELCAALEIVTPELILEQIESTLQLTGAAKGSEVRRRLCLRRAMGPHAARAPPPLPRPPTAGLLPQERDVLFGRLFACSALVRSHRVAALPAERQSATAARLSALLIAVGGAKAFLQEPAAAVTCELIRTLDPSVVEESVWPTVAPLLPVRAHLRPQTRPYRAPLVHPHRIHRPRALSHPHAPPPSPAQAPLVDTRGHAHTHTDTHTPLTHAHRALHFQRRGAPVFLDVELRAVALPLPHTSVCRAPLGT